MDRWRSGLATEFGDFIETVKPRGVIHSFATDVDDPTVQPR